MCIVQCCRCFCVHSVILQVFLPGCDVTLDSMQQAENIVYIVVLQVFFWALMPRERSRMSDVPLLSGISGVSFDSPFLSSLLFFYLVMLFLLSHG